MYSIPVINIATKTPAPLSTGFHYSFNNTVGSHRYSGAGARVFVAIFMTGTVSKVPTGLL